MRTDRAGTADPADDFPDLRRWSERRPGAATALRLGGLLSVTITLAKASGPAAWPLAAVAVAAVTAGVVATIALARRHPAVVPAAVLFGLCGAVLGGAGWSQAPGLTFMFISMVYLQALGEPRVVAVCTAAALVTVGILCALLTGHASNLAWIIGIILGGYVFGDARRSRLLALQRARQLLVMTRRANAEQAHAAALAERGRIARDVHDVLAHSLSGLALQLEAADALLTEGSDADVDAAHTMVVRARRLARDGLAEVRRAVAALREDVKPLAETLERLVADYGADTGWPASFEVAGGPVPALAVATAQGLRRVAQEALANARKHAPGAAVDVRLVVDGRRQELILTVSNGAAALATTALAESGGGWGLVGLRERVELLGGTLVAGPAGTTELTEPTEPTGLTGLTGPGVRSGGWQVSATVPIVTTDIFQN